MAPPHLRVLPRLPDDEDVPEPGSGPQVEHANAMAAYLAAPPGRDTDEAVWAAGLVAAFRADLPPASPRNSAQAVAKLGVHVCLLTLMAWGENAPVAPPHLAALMDVRNHLERPRGKTVRARVEAAASAPSGPGLVPLLAHLVSFAAVTRDGGDHAAHLVTRAIETLARARGVVAVRVALTRAGWCGA